MTKKFPINSPEVSEAIIARIRADAHRFLLAGGTIFPNADADNDLSEHIANTARLINPKQAAINEQWSHTLDGLDQEQHEQIWTAAVSMQSDLSEAAFLFGAFIGLALAALTIGEPLTTMATAPKARRRPQGGAR
jgi:hypothetical protein